VSGHKLGFKQALLPAEIERFWQMWPRYIEEDLAPYGDPPMGESERAELLSFAHRDRWRKLSQRPVDPARLELMTLDGKVAGFVIYVIYHSEDGKCLIAEYCLLPEHRGKGLGRQFYEALENRLRQQGAGYFVLENQNPPSRAFWAGLGFIEDKGYAWSENAWVKQ